MFLCAGELSQDMSPAVQGAKIPSRPDTQIVVFPFCVPILLRDTTCQISCQFDFAFDY